MIKSRLLNIWLIANLGIVWLVPQPSLAFSLFGPSDAEKQILYLQGYNAGIARVIATDGTTELVPVNPIDTKTTTQTYPAAATATTNSSVTNPLSANLDVGDFRIMSNTGARKINLDSNVNLNQWTISNGSVHLNSATMGYNPLSVGAFGTRAVALRAAATNTDAYAGIFTGNVNVDGLFRAKQVCVQDNMSDPGACLDDSAILGRAANIGVYGLALNGNAGSGVEGQGFRGVTGSATGNNGAGIYGKIVGGIENAYAGLFDGQVKINNGGLVIDHGTIKVDSASEGNGILSTVLVNGGTAIRGVATPDDSFAGVFLGNVDIDRGMLTINNPYSYSTTTRPEASVGLGVSGSDMGIVSFSYGLANNSVGVLGRGLNGLRGEAAYGNGKAIWGVAYPDYYPDSYAGYFDGRLEAVAPGTAIKGRSTSQEAGYGLYGIGHVGVIGIADYPGGIGVYGQAFAGELAGKFDGETEIMGGNLRFTNNLNPRLDINTNAASTLAINFSYDQNNSNPGGDFGINNLGDFVFNSNNRLGIGTSNPNANLHVKTTNNNAEIDIQSGNNTHWGIYQNMTGGALNFWHGDNRLTINDKGITTNGICLGTVCVTKWEDLKAILNPTPVPTKPGVVPAQQ